ncbi:MAG: hypothetical protein R2789_04425 [Microthrixaceae bacterium]
MLIGAALGSDPIALGELSAVGEIDPRFRDVVGFFTGLVTSFTPRWSTGSIASRRSSVPTRCRRSVERWRCWNDRRSRMSSRMRSPIRQWSRPFGALFTFIPGLPELLAPNAFGDPNAIYTAITAIAAVALLSADAPGFRDLLESLGISIPDELG